MTRDEILHYYGIQNFETVDEFLILLAKRFGKLKKGGIADTYAAAKQILNDWNVGKIKYYTCPPDIHDLPTYISTELICEFSKGFDMNDTNENDFNENTILDEDEISIDQISVDKKMDEVKDDLDEVLKKDTVIKFKNKREKDKKTENNEDLLKGMQLNKQLKLSFKKQKKKERRTIKISEKMSKELEQSLKLF